MFEILTDQPNNDVVRLGGIAEFNHEAFVDALFFEEGE